MDWNWPHSWNWSWHTPWPATIATICMSCFQQAVLLRNMELISHHQPAEFRKRQKVTKCPTTSQNPSRCHASWLNKVCTTRKDSESEWAVKDNSETNPIAIKTLQAMLQSSSLGFPYPTTLCLGIPSNKISYFVSTCHFRAFDKYPLSGPGRGPPSLQQNRILYTCKHLDSFWFP